MASELGTLARTQKSGGQISALESAGMFADVLRGQLTLIPEEWLYKMGAIKTAQRAFSEADLIAPDSALTQRANSVCRDASAPYLYNHCLRSYFWGLQFANLQNLTLDRELLFVAAMLHDMGLTDALRNAENRPACFTIISAAEAERCMREMDCNAHQIDLVCEAITLHMNIGVDLAHGTEAHVLNLATALDTTGLRLWRIPSDPKSEILWRYPRLGQNKALSACFCSEAKRFPGTRAAWLQHYVQISKRMERAPFQK